MSNLFSYGLLGSSGCGKTTILSCIVGIKKFKEGEIRVFGEKIDGVLGDKVGYMPQVEIFYTTINWNNLYDFLGNSPRGRIYC